MRDNKIRRWMDLIAALLRHRFPVTFDELRRDVPAYAAGRSEATVKRMFERDKDELRSAGIAIESLPDETGSAGRYRLRPTHFYLPLVQAAAVRHRPPRRPKGPGYQGIPVLAFEPEEFAAVVEAGRRAEQLGNGALALAAATALRKLGFDASPPPAAPVVVRASAADDATLAALAEALRQRRPCRFTYRSIGRDAVATRTVAPYGLAFVTGHWYLIGHDHDAGAIRQFRVSRIRDVEVPKGADAPPPVVVPADFNLAAHAASREAWELGDGDALDAEVRFTGASGVLAAAARLGAAVSGSDGRRRFRVRRSDVFARWLLSFGGDAVPVSPPALVAEWRALAARTAARYR